jgi:hypothetical protein
MKSPPLLGVYRLIRLPFIREASANIILACQDLHESPSATGHWCDSSLARHQRYIISLLLSLPPAISHFVNLADTIVPLLPQSA